MVNGGKKIKPKLLTTAATIDEGTLDIPTEHFAIILDGMTRVVNDPRGTAHATAFKEDE